jgi:hypothetical protein
LANASSRHGARLCFLFWQLYQKAIVTRNTNLLRLRFRMKGLGIVMKPISVRRLGHLVMEIDLPSSRWLSSLSITPYQRETLAWPYAICGEEADSVCERHDLTDRLVSGSALDF